MRIDYLLDATSICGGVKVVIEQAHALACRGVSTRIIALQPRPDWIDVSIPFLHVPSFTPERFSGSDFVVTTYFRQVLELNRYEQLRGRVIHLFQGYEGDYVEARNYLDAIEEAYRLPIIRWAVSERLADYAQTLCRNGCETFTVGQAIDHSVFFPASDTAAGPDPSVLLMGDLENSSKGIPVGLETFRLLRSRVPGIRLVRISLRDLREKEKHLCEADEYHASLLPHEVAEIMRRARLLLSTSTRAEGFGLPLLEALACGLPAVAARIPSYEAFSSREEVCRFVDDPRAESFAEAVISLWNDREERSRLRSLGFAVAAGYTYDAVAERIISWLQQRARRRG